MDDFRPGKMKFTTLTRNREKYAARSGAAQTNKFTHVIDSRLYTTAQVAERLGVSRSRAGEIMRRTEGPYTWEQLENRPGARRRPD